jgi:alpha-D-ribose 1-methylphosphonate 5-triphosphate synthase subunit PhnL
MRTPLARDLLIVEDVGKTFTLHLHAGARLPVFEGVSFEVARGECVALGGASGVGKSSILKIVYGAYHCQGGRVWLNVEGRFLDLAGAGPREILDARRRVMGYVSQFLRVIPRVSALDIVAAAARESGLDATQARTRAASLLERLHLPERLWGLPPATFSGGEQQRVNVARGFAAEHALLILDEPTASLDARNRDAVVDLIAERRARGAGLLAIFHDAETRARVADRVVDVTAFRPSEAA